MLGFDLDQNAVAAISTGGANQLARRYLEIKELAALPVVAVLSLPTMKNSLKKQNTSLRRLKVIPLNICTMRSGIITGW